MLRSAAEQTLFKVLNGENILTIEQVKEIICAPQECRIQLDRPIAKAHKIAEV